MKIEDLTRTLVQDEANRKGETPTDVAMRAGPPRGRGSSGRGRGSSRGRGERGRGSSSFRGGRGGYNSSTTTQECRTCLSAGHTDDTCFYTHPDIAPEAFLKKYPDERSRRSALALRKAENQARKNNEFQKKQQQQGGNPGGGSSFVSNACLPIPNDVVNNAMCPQDICLPNDSSLKGTTLSAAQLRATPWYIDSCSSMTLSHNIHDFKNLKYGSQRSFLTANGT